MRIVAYACILRFIYIHVRCTVHCTMSSYILQERMYNIFIHKGKSCICTVSQHVCFCSQKLAKLPTLVVLYLSPVILDYIPKLI